ncbi:MAG: TonB-dependent receptor [Prevotella sp.]|nr:TonB-dependent receptor [Candidatus Equicola stercoris]
MKRLYVFIGVLLYVYAMTAQTITGDTIKEVSVIGIQKKNIQSSTPLHNINSDDVLRLGVTDIADAIHRLPGITLRDYGGAGGMKTISVRGFGSQHTGVSYDGMMLSDCQTGQIDLQRYSLDNMKEIRLQVGDNENIFLPARNIASAAVLELTSDDNRKTNYYKLTTGSWGMINPMVNVGTNINKVYLGVNADFLHADNNYPFTLTNVTQQTREKRTNSKMNQGQGEINVGYSTDHSSLTGKIYYYDNDRELPGVVHLYTDDNDENLRERNMFAQMRYKTTFNDRLSLMINGKWNLASTDYHNGKPTGGVTSAEYWQREYYGSMALLYDFDERWSANYSADYFVNDINSDVMVDADRKSLLQSLSAKYAIDRLSLTARVLWSNYLSENQRLSPSLSLSYRLLADERLYVRASYKNIFRMPSFNELYFFHMGTQDLLPETTDQFNVGVTWANSRQNVVKAMMTIDAYYNKVSDKIVSVPINMFVWRNINIGKVDAYGLDFTADVTYNITSRQCVGITTNYSLQKIENTTNSESKYYRNQIAYTPVHSGSMTVSWQNPWVSMSVTGDGMSERWATNEHTEGTNMAGFMEFAVSAYKTIRCKACEFTLRGDILNIFDKQYDIVAHYPMPGRSFKVSLAVRM